MDADRRERAKSIRAARDWLMGAENALAGEDDLAGDLKLMLARAELARVAADRRARFQRWSTWLVPSIAAAGVIAWMLWGKTAVPETVPPPAAQEAAISVEARAPVPDPTAFHPPEQPLPAATQSAEYVPSERESPPAADRVEESGRAADTEPVSPHLMSRASVHMPNADLQRLMQVGGKILRE